MVIVLCVHHIHLRFVFHCNCDSLEKNCGSILISWISVSHTSLQTCFKLSTEFQFHLFSVLHLISLSPSTQLGYTFTHRPAYQPEHNSRLHSKVCLYIRYISRFHHLSNAWQNTRKSPFKEIQFHKQLQKDFTWTLQKYSSAMQLF